MEFMREGGLFMWVMLAVALGACAGAIARRASNGDRIAAAGAFACLSLGLVGLSMGLAMTTAAAQRFAAAERADILAIGIRESINNSVFGALLALALGAAALTLGRGRARAA
jgi:hypothetical protein